MALALIFTLYVCIGVLAAGGTIALLSRHFSPKAEQVLYGLVLAPIAGMYLAFTAHFSAGDAWRLEALAVAFFVALGVLGTRLLIPLMLGYALHGAWDLGHEIVMSGIATSDPVTLTSIPLAYGAFCLAFDWYMVGYFYTRRHQWSAA